MITAKELLELDLPIINGFFASYEFDNGEIGAWNGDGNTVDAFMLDLIMREGEYIKRFTEIIQDIRDGKDIPPEKISVRKYNTMLRQMKKDL